MSDWFEEWFGEEYLALYAHRDDADARAVAELIHRRVRLPAGSPALDLASGAGRHARAFGAHWWTVGLDLSPALLRAARGADHSAPLVRGDMRELPFRASSFTLVVNLFTSFGYFSDDSQHERVVEEVGRVTRAGGVFVLDYLNASYVRDNLVAHDERRVGSRVVEQERSISADGRYVCKTIRLSDEGRQFTERVRLFEPAELVDMLDRCCFDLSEILGDHSGSPHSGRSPRTIMFAKRR
ncbi:MAG: class I SAM-dependent methyltransferase [Gemmatimonadaceae bacterium]